MEGGLKGRKDHKIQAFLISYTGWTNGWKAWRVGVRTNLLYISKKLWSGSKHKHQPPWSASNRLICQHQCFTQQSISLAACSHHTVRIEMKMLLADTFESVVCSCITYLCIVWALQTAHESGCKLAFWNMRHEHITKKLVTAAAWSWINIEIKITKLKCGRNCTSKMQLSFGRGEELCCLQNNHWTPKH